MPSILGVRHHGPGSARSVLKALEALEPDCLLIEGPADLSPMLSHLAHPELEPPIALVSYQVDKPGKASYFPFAVFSPEYQAIRLALKKGIELRFFDLPQRYMAAAAVFPAMPASDPMELIAKASGHKHYEHWWNILVEERRDAKDIFTGVLELMQALRAEDLPMRTEAAAEADELNLPPMPEALKDQLKEQEAKRQASLRLALQREAFMRQSIRQAKAEGFKKIAVVCGAFHGPALVGIDSGDLAVTDADILKDMPELRIEAAWVPWSYGRLAAGSGYGAGVVSPGWYQHLWEQGNEAISASAFASIWLGKVAGFLRSEGFDISPAHIIEAVRLSEALAAMREQSYPGLAELMEATQTAMCAGDARPIGLIQRRLIVGERMGFVPLEMPMVPLQKDIYRQQQLLKLRPLPEKSTLKLDLRNDLHAKRSQFLQQLRLLDIPWGESLSMRAKSGSFREAWTLEWKPEYAMKVIEASRWGTTVLEAAAACALDQAEKAESLDKLCQLLDLALLAALDTVIVKLMQRIAELSASNADLVQMMKALAPLARVMRYGSVRALNQELLVKLIDILCIRICIQLPKACLNLSDDLAKERCDLLVQTESVVRSLHKPEHSKRWQESLLSIAEHGSSQGLIAGKATRLLLDSRAISKQKVQEWLTQRLNMQRSQAKTLAELKQTAFWIEGFFKGSALSLIHDEHLWQQLDAWVLSMQAEDFLAILPLLRRTFASFSQSSRQQLQDKAKGHRAALRQSADFNHEQARQVLPLIAALLGQETVEVDYEVW